MNFGLSLVENWEYSWQQHQVVGFLNRFINLLMEINQLTTRRKICHIFVKMTNSGNSFNIKHYHYKYVVHLLLKR